MSLREEAYASVKQALLKGRLAPGQFVTQKELCELLGVSIAPLRDALKDLEREEFLSIMPQRGVRFRTLDRAFIENAFQLRSFLELGAIREVVATGRTGFVEAIRNRTADILRQAEEHIDADLLTEAHEVDMQFHHDLVAALENDMLATVHESISDQIRMIRLNNRYVASRLRSALTEHLNIMDACLAGDAEAAATALEEHLAISRSRALGDDDIYL